MKKLFALALVLCLAGAFAAAETPAVPWKGYELTVPYATASMESYGIPSMEGAIACVRIQAAEGTIAYSDFQQPLFTLNTTLLASPTHTKPFIVPVEADNTLVDALANSNSIMVMVP